MNIVPDIRFPNINVVYGLCNDRLVITSTNLPQEKPYIACLTGLTKFMRYSYCIECVTTASEDLYAAN